MVMLGVSDGMFVLMVGDNREIMQVVLSVVELAVERENCVNEDRSLLEVKRWVRCRSKER